MSMPSWLRLLPPERLRIALLLCCLSCTQVVAAPLWVDVRTPEEFAAGHVPGAVNIPYASAAIGVKALTTDLDTDIRVYCAVGVRAQFAKFQLESAGYRRVTNEGGYERIKQRLAHNDPTSECAPNVTNDPTGRSKPC